MLGHVLFRVLLQDPNFTVFGSARNRSSVTGTFTKAMQDHVVDGVDAVNFKSVLKAVDTVRPTIIINCIGVIKQLSSSHDPLYTIPINTLFPHQLARLCQEIDSRLIHISTDCVFDGARGGYKEADPVSATDLYGLSKYLGEVTGSGLLTLRTSIIGHEMASSYGLLEWLLGQKEPVKGFTRAIFSGFPTVELCRIIRDFVLPNPLLEGLYQVSSLPISKDALLRLIADIYHKKITIEPTEMFCCDRSLDSSKFRQTTGFLPSAWPDMIQAMHDDYLNSPLYAERRRLRNEYF